MRPPRLHAAYTFEQLEFLAQYHQAAIKLTRREITNLTENRAKCDAKCDAKRDAKCEEQ